MGKNIAIFASGSGTNAENIIQYFKENDKVIVKLVVTNNPNAYVLERAKGFNIPSFCFPKVEWVEGERILNLMMDEHIDFIVLAGFLLKIPMLLISAFPNKIVNIHPALLPKYGGKSMYGNKVHEAVVNAKEKESGITIHFIDENYDRGSIIFQAKCQVSSSDTPEDVAGKIHKLEYKWYPVIIESEIKKLI